MLWRFLCWPCIVAGAGLFLVSFASYAQSAGSTQIDAGTYWRDVASGAIGLCLVMIGAYMRSVDSRLRTTSDALLKNYLTKEETTELIELVLQPMNVKIGHADDSIKAVHRRLDKLKVPAAAADD